MRRIALTVTMLLAMVAPAQASASTDVDAELARYPELTIRITDAGFELPEEIAAGRYHLVQENATPENGHFFIARLPDDVSDAAFEAALASPEEPEWFGRLALTGNPDRAAAAGGRAEGIVDLPAGRYFVMDPTAAPPTLRRFDAVADSAATPSPGGEPAADVAAEMREMAFDMPDRLPAGRHLWRVANTGALPHELAILPVPTGATVDEAIAAIGALFEGAAPSGRAGPAWADWEIAPAGGMGVTSAGGAAWTAVDLASGTYVAVCFYPDPATGQPHLLLGMTKIFTVAGSSTTPTP